MLEKMEVITDTEMLLSLKSFRNQAVQEYSQINFQLLYAEALLLTPSFKNTVADFFLHLEKEQILQGN